MRIIRADIDGAFRVEDELTMYGVFSARVYVARGGRLVLYGTCADGLLVGAGGSAEIYGTVRGDLVNYGRVLLAGAVTGAVADQGQMTVDAAASVKGDQSKRAVQAIPQAAAASLAPKTGRRPRASSWSGQPAPEATVAPPSADRATEADPPVTEPGAAPPSQGDPPPESS